MYFENSSPSREGWKFSYKGHELAESAKKLLLKFRKEELAHRTELANLLNNKMIAGNDERVGRARKSIELNGKEAEACSVWVFEFSRNPEREYNLSLGDVVYFGFNYNILQDV